MRVRFQADADLDGRVIRGLKRVTPEIDLRTAAEAELDDLEVLRIGSATGSILISQDRRTMPGNFRRHIASGTSPGVILLRPGISIADAIDEIVIVWSASQPAEWKNRLVWISL
jgi:predicted nuclease of predicted toxin-antitoxin system